MERQEGKQLPYAVHLLCGVRIEAESALWAVCDMCGAMPISCRLIYTTAITIVGEGGRREQESGGGGLTVADIACAMAMCMQSNIYIYINIFSRHIE